MKCSLLLYVAILVALSGCQNFPVLYPTNKTHVPATTLDQLSLYGAKFAYEYKDAATATCTKYTRLYQQGDWRAGWILALQLSDTKSKQCLSSKQAIQILTTLQSAAKIDPDLMWLTEVHLNWLIELEKKAKKVSQLRREISRKQAQVTELEAQNQNLVEKLEALKAIETSINQ